MGLNKKPYRGTRDFFPKESRARDFLFKMMRKTAHSFGYESYDGPLLEEVDLYRAKSGDELINEQIYSFIDRGEREVAIRPEMTPTLARMVAQISKEAAKPLRWFSIPNLMRYEKPQKGRLREHWQFNCDIFGAPEQAGELEILQMAIKLLTNFGATNEHFEILVNDRRIIDFVFNTLMSLDKETSYKLYKIVDRSKKVTPEALNKMVDELGLEEDKKTIFWDYLRSESLGDILSFLKAQKNEELLSGLKNFSDLLEELDLLKFFKYDPTIVRGLDYYTGMVFEIYDKHPDNRRAICGGGAYSDLLKIFGEKPMAGVGFGLGDVTLKDFLKVHDLLPSFEIPENDIFITYQDIEAHSLSLKLANDLRNHDLKVITALDTLKFKKVFPQAQKKGAKFVALFGSDEISNKTVQIKNLATKDQKTFSTQDVEAIVNYIKI